MNRGPRGQNGTLCPPPPPPPAAPLPRRTTSTAVPPLVAQATEDEQSVRQRLEPLSRKFLLACFSSALKASVHVETRSDASLLEFRDTPRDLRRSGIGESVSPRVRFLVLSTTRHWKIHRRPLGLSSFIDKPKATHASPRDSTRTKALT